MPIDSIIGYPDELYIPAAGLDGENQIPGRGRTNLRITKAAVHYVEQEHQEIDSSLRAYYGHSLSGTAAVDAAYFDDKACAAYQWIWLDTLVKGRFFS